MKSEKNVWIVLGLVWVMGSGFLFGTSELTVTKVQGNCTIAEPQEYEKYAQKGYKCEPKDVLATYHKGYLDFAMKDFAACRILPHSQCEIVQADGGTIKLRLLEGNAIFNIPEKKRNRRFVVDTPTAVAAARGTQFWGRVNTDEVKNAQSTFASREGEVEITVKSTGETHTIGKGEAIDIPYDETGRTVAFRLATEDEMNAMAQASEIST